jgi:hypothetical protein
VHLLHHVLTPKVKVKHWFALSALPPVIVDDEEEVDPQHCIAEALQHGNEVVTAASPAHAYRAHGAGAIGAAGQTTQGEEQMLKVDKRAEPGQAVYTRSTLRLYDLVVLGISNHWVWRCPSARLLAHYNRHVRPNHLDVGVGTGYFLDRCRFPSLKPRIALMDANPHALDYTARRIARYCPDRLQQDVLASGFSVSPGFDSVGINYLLHCLPGTMASKGVALDNLRPLMNPGAVIFGSTLLQGGVRRSRAARHLMDFYNRRGVFSNEGDDVEGLARELGRRFRNVTLDIVGCVALFSART